MLNNLPQNLNPTKLKHLFATLLITLVINCYAQRPNAKFNLDFEQNTQHKKLPDNWFQWGTYNAQKDSVIVRSGNYATVVASGEKSGEFGSIAYRIPANYKGDSITLQGYMRLEKVENGYAGLMLRVDGNGTSLAFDNMQNRNITGTREWGKYTITLPFPKAAETIYVAGILAGEGKAWFDDFTLAIDGKDVQTLKEVAKELPKAMLDKRFDEGSAFNIRVISKQQTDRLFKLCKIWGFLKYHHPAIARGDANWDYELLAFRPKIDAAKIENELLVWVKSLGTVGNDSVKSPEITNIKMLPDTKWLSDHSLLGKELSQELLRIEKWKRAGPNYYVSFKNGVGNPEFQNEVAYPRMKWDDTGYRLLALFRYWNMIDYFFPYRYLITKGWDDVLKEYLPKMVACRDELSYKRTVLFLIGEVHDTHANIWSSDLALRQYLGSKVAPIDIRIIENSAVVVKKANPLNFGSRIRVGDIVTHINGIKTEELIAEKIKYCPASNEPTKLRDVSGKLLRTNSDSICLTVSGLMGTFSETAATIPFTYSLLFDKEVPSHAVIKKDIGYLFPGTLQKGEIDQIMNSFLTKKGIIIDLRCYPSDFIVFSLGKYLMPTPTAFVKFTHSSLSHPGLFSFGEPLKVGESNPDYYRGKVVILVNEITQSQAEYTAMALRVAPKATVIGSTTAGADGNVSAIQLPGNIRTMISGIGVYYPDGTETQRVGIVPDIVVRPTIRGIKLGKDALLDKAIEVINRD